MATLVEGFLPTLDAARGLLGAFGLRPFRVSVLVRTWSGRRAGEGTSTDAYTPLKVGSNDPKVRQVDPRDVVASGGDLTTSMFDIGPMTPEFEGGGTTYASIDPPVTGSATEVFFVVWGPGLPDAGALCKRVSSQTDSPFRYTVRVERLGRSV